MNRIRGAFFGQLVGDALGSRYEFLTRSTTQKMIKEDTIDGHLPLLGNGEFRTEPGMITDDSELALSLAESLIRRGGFDQKDVASAYAYWYFTDPPDAGVTTRGALSICKFFEHVSILSFQRLGTSSRRILC
jgi:ADP-ribosyl-[dinitrogen reductase] hydrolase